MLSSLAGGAGIALLIFRAPAQRSNVPVTPDPFAGNGIGLDPLNYAHIRVAGLGGAGLVVAAAAVALQYQLTAAAVALGLVGGLTGGVGAVVVRRRRLFRDTSSAFRPR